MADEIYGKGIKVASGFDLGAKSPLDTRSIANTIEERNAHVTGNRAYIGMKVYVLENAKEYIYNGVGWDEAGGISDEELAQLTTAYQHSQTKHVTEDDIPSNVSELVNDLSFATETYVENEIKEIDGKIDTINENINKKVDNVDGMGLSQENYTTEEKTKLSEIQIITTSEIDDVINDVFNK